MEKFRPFTDRATGIDPFVCFVKPTAFSYVMACVLFPFRLVLALILIVLLLLFDIIHFASACCGVRVNYFISLLLLLPYCTSVCLRGVVFVLTNCIVRKHVMPSVNPYTHLAKVNCTNVVNSRVPEVIVINSQSMWDVLVAELALNTRDYVVTFPVPPTKMSEHLNKNKQFTETMEDLSKSNVKIFTPGCFSRWRVMMYILYTGTLHFLQQWSVYNHTKNINSNSNSNNSSSSNSNSRKNKKKGVPMTESDLFTINLQPIQEKMMKEQQTVMPILLFAEGTTSNGRGVLTLPSVQLLYGTNKGNKNESLSSEQQHYREERLEESVELRCISVYYNSPSLFNVITESKKPSIVNNNFTTNNNINSSSNNKHISALTLLKCWFQSGVLLFGSKDAKWRSPLLPSAVYTINKQQIKSAQVEPYYNTYNLSRPKDNKQSELATGLKQSLKEPQVTQNEYTQAATNSIVLCKINGEATRELQTGFVNAFTNRMLQRQRLSIGIQEKL